MIVVWVFGNMIRLVLFSVWGLEVNMIFKLGLRFNVLILVKLLICGRCMMVIWWVLVFVVCWFCRLRVFLEFS